jgi:hypothetical protein
LSSRPSILDGGVETTSAVLSQFLRFLGGGFYLDAVHGSQRSSPSLTNNINLVTDTPAIIESPPASTTRSQKGSAVPNAIT